MASCERGFIIILSAPSGAGKTTLANYLVQTLPGIQFSVSTTTRKPRPGETPGQDYHFVDQDSFCARIDRNEFLEWAKVFGNYYGTGRANADQVLEIGTDLLLVIDWQGARQVRASMSLGTVISIAVAPPSRSTLHKRLLARGSDDPQVIARRMAEAEEEIAHWDEYDYLLINDELAKAQADLVAIVTAERLRRHRSENRMRSVLATFAEH